MMKIFLKSLFFVFVFNITTTFSQISSKGNVIIDSYYGFPNGVATLYFLFDNLPYSTEMSVQQKSYFGPIGIKGEYLLFDRIGVGVDLCYSQNIFYNYVYNPYGDNSTNFENNYLTQKMGGIATFTYHFTEKERFDFFVSGGVGGSYRTFTNKEYDYDLGTFIKYYDEPIFDYNGRIGFGMRYFFTQNVGANFNFGIGQGSIINGGISFKLR